MTGEQFLLASDAFAWGKTMRFKSFVATGLGISLAIVSGPTFAEAKRAFAQTDVFNLEWVSEPRLSNDGKRIVFVRNHLDVMEDRRRSTIWLSELGADEIQPLTTGERNDRGAQFSPSGKEVAYLSGGQIYLRYLASGRELKLTRETRSVGNFAFSPNGKFIVFSMSVPGKSPEPAKLPNPPPGAKWAEPVSVIDRLSYRADGEGIVAPQFQHLFLIPVNGGNAKQVTEGNFDYRQFDFIDDQTLVVSANREADAEYQPLQSDLFEISLTGKPIKRLTLRNGPDQGPSVSPDGRYIAYTGFADRQQFYQVSTLSILDRRSGETREITSSLDRDVVNPQFDASGKTIYFQYDDQGRGKIASISIDGKNLRQLADDLGGADIGRPYGSGSMHSAATGAVVYTRGSATRPSELGFIERASKPRSLTEFNADALAQVDVRDVETIWVKSSVDERKVQAWIMYPPGFDPTKKYPLLLEIHGGPVANYGPHFAPETQLYAAQGYIVVYANPRGSDSYGQDFGNAIHHDYPNHDYDDLMDVTNAVISKGSVDERNLFVTGGSGGGVLTAWIVGHTDRFRAAVVAKPVINWVSFALTSDGASFYPRYWFPGNPWDQMENYVKRSPLSYVGKVNTPTMLITGEADQRTPIAESEQYFTALKLRKIPTQMVRIPGASHAINARPSNLLAQVANTIAWFERFRVK